MSNSKGLQMTAPFPPNPKATPKRKPVKEQLRKSELRTYALLDNSPNQIFLKDRELRYLYVNLEFERARRFDREHVRGKKVVVIPVLDVDRAKEFYGRLGWRLDADFHFDNGFRVVQFTPPGSGARSNSARTSLRPSPAQPKGCTWSSPTSGLRATTT
jgi:PAS domain-containing protein